MYKEAVFGRTSLPDIPNGMAPIEAKTRAQQYLRGVLDATDAVPFRLTDELAKETLVYHISQNPMASERILRLWDGQTIFVSRACGSGSLKRKAFHFWVAGEGWLPAVFPSALLRSDKKNAWWDMAPPARSNDGPWSRQTHHLRPAVFKEAVRELLMCRQFLKLPADIQETILGEEPSQTPRRL